MEKSGAAKTERALRRSWERCVKSEELEHFLKKLLKEGVAVPMEEEFLLSEEGRMKVKTMGNNSKNEIRYWIEESYPIQNQTVIEIES